MLRCFIGLGLVYLMLYVIVSIIFLNRPYYVWICPIDTVIVFRAPSDGALMIPPWTFRDVFGEAIIDLFF